MKIDYAFLWRLSSYVLWFGQLAKIKLKLSNLIPDCNILGVLIAFVVGDVLSCLDVGVFWFLVELLIF